MVRKELRAVSRERTIMIAVFIQLIIASFSSVIVVGLLAYYDPETMAQFARGSVTVGYVGNSRNELVGYLEAERVRVVAFDDTADAAEAFARSLVDAIIVAPESQGGPVEVALFVPESETRSTVIMMVLTQPLKRYENSVRLSRGIEVRYANMPGDPPTSFEFVYSTILPILMFFPAFIAGSMTMDSIAEEFENHTIETLWSAPLSLNHILLSKIVSSVILAAIQCVLWIMLLRANHISLSSPLLVFVLALLVAAISAASAGIVAIVLKDRERSQFIYSLVIMAVVGASYLLTTSPVTLLTRYAIGDAFTGPINLVGYIVLLAGLLLVVVRSSRRLAGSGI